MREASDEEKKTESNGKEREEKQELA